jgi:hypothetical protein
MLLSVGPPFDRMPSRCLLKIEAASANSDTQSVLSTMHESSSYHGILLEPWNY